MNSPILNGNDPKIFVDSFDFCKEVVKSTRVFPKPTRYVLGQMLEKKSLNFLIELNSVVGPSGFRFVRDENRNECLKRLSLNLDELRLLLRMARETGAYSSGQFYNLSSKTQQIGRQLGGMIRYQKKSP